MSTTSEQQVPEAGVAHVMEDVLPHTRPQLPKT